MLWLKEALCVVMCRHFLILPRSRRLCRSAEKGGNRCLSLRRHAPCYSFLTVFSDLPESFEQLIINTSAYNGLGINNAACRFWTEIDRRLRDCCGATGWGRDEGRGRRLDRQHIDCELMVLNEGDQSARCMYNKAGNTGAAALPEGQNNSDDICSCIKFRSGSLFYGN